MLENLRSTYFDGELERLISGSGIEIIRDFLTNWDMMVKFQERFYREGVPRIVLCGLNPGRYGAGKTGIPFIDFQGLAKLMPESATESVGSERSSQFFFNVIEKIGADRFFQSFYVTNISWVGFARAGKNINFYDLPDAAHQRVLDLFEEEMRTIRAEKIIAIGQRAQTAAKKTVGAWANCDDVLHHPNYCAFPRNFDASMRSYLGLLEPLAKVHPSGRA